MSLPPALLQRLAQRGLVNKQNSKDAERNAAMESEEVIAEDYDEMDTDPADEDPSQYERMAETTVKKRTEENFWLERMKARMGDAGSAVGYKGCPNKYNIWHKCNLFCVNRWADGRPEPGREYMRRYKRLLRKYPLPKGWTESYDPGCGCYYFCSKLDNLVSWLPPTHPKSQVTKSAAAYRRQMEEANGEEGSDSDEQMDDADDQEESSEARHHREIEEIINSSLHPRAQGPTVGGTPDFPSSKEVSEGGGGGGGIGGGVSISMTVARKPKSRDLERTLLRQRRDKDRLSSARHHGRDAAKKVDILDPMDPSAYSDIPRGKWSDGLNTGSEERKKPAPAAEAENAGRERGNGGGGGGAGRERERERYKERSDEEDNDSRDFH